MRAGTVTPFFSVLIPTRDRADLLVDSALRSVLAQTFDDFEVVVCDNASSDHTRERVSALADPRVRFVRSETWIPKEHFFEFALRQARGEYALLFFDDDYLTTTAIEIAHRVLRAHPHDVLAFNIYACYFYPDWHLPSQRNVMQLPRFSGELRRLESRRHVAEIFARVNLLPESPTVPTIFRTTFIHELMDAHGSLFPHGHMGDINTAIHVLTRTPTFLFLDCPLALFGHWKNNTTAQLHEFKTTMPEYQEWIAWFTRTHIATMPVPAYFWSNCVAATLRDMKRQLDLEPALEPANYFQALHRELQELERHDVDVSVPRRAWLAAIHRLPHATRAQVVKALINPEPPQAAPGTEVLARDVGPRSPVTDRGRVFLKAGDYGVDTMLGAGRLFEKIVAGDVSIPAGGDDGTPLPSRERFARWLRAHPTCRGALHAARRALGAGRLRAAAYSAHRRLSRPR